MSASVSPFDGSDTWTEGPFPFVGPVRRLDEPGYNEAAHGCVTYVDVAKCGTRRRRCVNGRHQEVGAWTR